MGMMCMSDAEAKDDKKTIPEKAPAQEFSQAPSITKGTVTIKGKSIPYTATTGFMNITDDNGAVKATMFYVAYVRSDMASEKRPITFAFNGGPGSSSVWLHMGALGPKRVVLTDKGDMPKPPGNMVDNEYSWLEFTDLVFIDPVGTGYSRPAKDEKKEQFHGLDEDVTSVGTFIRLYTTQNKRWLSPKFLAGESYGTTRAAYLSDHLADRHGMYVNGILLISMVLDFQTLRFSPANDVASTAEHTAVTEKLSRYTGLSKEFIASTNNRPDIFRFTKELLRDEGKTVGRLDSRFTGIDRDNAGENFEYDPSYNAVIYAPFTSTVNHYLRSTLGFESDLPYEILTGKVQPWNWGSAERGFPYVGEALRKAMTKNKFLKVYVANGWYDLATPFFAAEYTMNHLPLESSLRNNISMKYYRSGHMMYIEKESLKQFTKDVEQFYGNTLAD